MREIRAMSGRGMLVLICSLLMVFQPVSAASDPPVIAGVNTSGPIQSNDALALEGTMVAVTPVVLPFISHGGPSNAPESIAVAKLTGTADRNGRFSTEASCLVVISSVPTGIRPYF